ncbi:hypothetical protein A2U01_0096819, partial [Trifolium medium]|nr:hypothetical protein [Trifolium medium]
PDQKSDRVRRCSVPTPVKRRGLCTCRCSGAQVSESEAEVFFSVSMRT